MNFTQPVRLFHLFSYILIIYLLYLIGFGTFIIPTSAKGFWFYTGLAALTLGSYLVTPKFTDPANGLSYAFAGLVSLLAVFSDQFKFYAKISWWFVIAYSILVILAALLAIAFKDTQREKIRSISDLSRLFVQSFGDPLYLYPFLVIFSISAFHSDKPKEIVVILVSTILIILKPIERIHLYARRLQGYFLSQIDTDRVGVIASYQHPGIILIKLQPKITVPSGSLLLANDPLTGRKLYLALNETGREELVLLRAIEFNLSKSDIKKIGSIYSESNDVHLIKTGYEGIIEIPDHNSLIGIVDIDSNIRRIKIEVVTDQDLSTGILVKTNIGERKNVLYQIIDATTHEDQIKNKNTYGYLNALAIKVGKWENKQEYFNVVNWTPSPNSIVTLYNDETTEPTLENTIGTLPGSHLPAKYKELSSFVTHNTAILGALGVGKSSIALELVERLAKEGVKLLVLDMTNEYANELSPLIDKEITNNLIESLDSVGPAGKTKYQQIVSEGGSINECAKIIRESIKKILNSSKSTIVINPNEIEIWKQDSRLYDHKATMAPLTPTEVTKIFTEAALEVSQENGKTTKARFCIVYEEAHSLIPEFTSIVNEGDKTATNGTARAILQGRKFGMGCILISQRSANVTKSILNQCHSIFAMRMFDETGMGFLRSYIGDDLIKVMPNLPEQQAIFFGRASASSNPIIIQSNDRKKFLSFVRTEEKGKRRIAKKK